VAGTREIRIDLGGGDRGGDGGTAVSGLLVRPAGARALLVLGHGAGAGMRHPFMERVAAELAARDIATLRYQFPYMEAGRKRPDPPGTAMAAVRAALAAGAREHPDLPLFAGGKSFGGRMTSRALAEEADGGGDDRPDAGDAPDSPAVDTAAVRGLVFLGFPLHPAGRPSTARAEHLAAVRRPMLFVQGTRDALAELPLVRGVVDGLGGLASLHVVDGADHSFHVLKRSGRSDGDVMTEICDAVAGWIVAT
jgi:uncharacterized protein